MSEPVLDVAGVSVLLGGRRVLEWVDLRVDAGEAVALLGPNGAGKTTLLRAVLGLVPVAEGSINLSGGAQRGGRAPVLGYVPQRHEFAWDFPVSVVEAVMTGRTRTIGWVRRAKRDDHDVVDDALEQVGLADLRNRPISQLSGGQRQRVLVARALAGRPMVLLLDEPFTGVDVPTQEVLTALLARLVDRGQALLMTTHDLSAAAASSTRLCLLNRRVVATGTPAELQDPAVWLEAFGVPSSAQLLTTLVAGGGHGS